MPRYDGSMIPLIDLNRWREGDRAAVAAETDAALQESGFLMVSGHGVSVELRAGVRAGREAVLRAVQPSRRCRTRHR